MNEGHTFYEKPKYSQFMYDVLLRIDLYILPNACKQNRRNMADHDVPNSKK